MKLSFSAPLPPVKIVAVASIRLLPALFACWLLSGCASPLLDIINRKHSRAFTTYWPPAKGDTRLRLAVKDLIDVKGAVTTAGSGYLATSGTPATRDAACLRIARSRPDVVIVGKTNLTEFAVTVSGRNNHFGTPVNLWDGEHKAIPGGSSSGSAVAIQRGLADVAFGTDSGGSIRVPAACCGIYGLKTTYGLISTRGLFPVSPEHLDTVGPMAADIPRLVQGMELLQGGFTDRYRRAMATTPSARQLRIGRFYVGNTNPAIDTAIDEALRAQGFKIVKLDASFKEKWRQAEKDGKTLALAGAWENDEQYLDKPGIGPITKLVILSGQLESSTNFKDAVKRKSRWQRDLNRVFDQVDFIALPTMQQLPSAMPWFGTGPAFELLVFASQNTLAVNFAGNPAIAVPIRMPKKHENDKTSPVTSLQLIGPKYSEAQLVNAGRLLEPAR